MTGVRWIGVVLILALVIRICLVFAKIMPMSAGLQLLAFIGAIVLLVMVWITIRTPKGHRGADLGESVATPLDDEASAQHPANRAGGDRTAPLHDATYEFLLLDPQLPALLVTVPGEGERRTAIFETLMSNGWAVIEPPLSTTLGGRPVIGVTFDDRDLLLRQPATLNGSAPFARAELVGPIPAGWSAAAQAQESAPLLLLRVGGSTPTTLERLHDLAMRRELIGTRVGVVSYKSAG